MARHTKEDPSESTDLKASITYAVPSKLTSYMTFGGAWRGATAAVYMTVSIRPSGVRSELRH
jgi:hypothetical protein